MLLQLRICSMLLFPLFAYVCIHTVAACCGTWQPAATSRGEALPSSRIQRTPCVKVTKSSDEHTTRTFTFREVLVFTAALEQPTANLATRTRSHSRIPWRLWWDQVGRQRCVPALQIAVYTEGKLGTSVQAAHVLAHVAALYIRV